MITLNEILNKVYLYYPKYMAFDSLEYQTSEEYLRLLKKREEANKNIEYKKYLKNNLENVFKGYEVVDWTALDSYNCYEYRILLHKEQSILDDDVELMTVLGNKRLDLFVFLSALEKYYYIQVTYTEYHSETDEWIFKINYEFPINLKDEINDLNLFLSTENYVELSTEIVKEKIFDIETELKLMGIVSIFDCFFTDLVTI